MLCARRIELGELKLDSPVSHYLAEFDRADKQMITIRELLTHTSGLPAWRPLYILAKDDPERAAGAIATLDLEYKPGTRVVYSDLGFIALGILLERHVGHPLPQMAKQEIFEPLKLEHTFFNPELALQTGIAACETGNAYEIDMCKQTGAGEYQNSRQRLIWGEVHDGNAYFLGGAGGHAGLFSTARETFVLAQQFLPDSTRLLKPQTCRMFRENMTAGLEEARSIGWQLAATKDSTAGTDLPPDSFGHNGFTGTSLWIDPEHRRIFILLTNRTHARCSSSAKCCGASSPATSVTPSASSTSKANGMSRQWTAPMPRTGDRGPGISLLSINTNFDQRLFFIGEGIILIEPKIRIELGYL